MISWQQVISTLPDAIGVVGVAIVLWAYLMLQMGKLEASRFSYSFLNFVGSVFILFSLYFSWNLASVIIEIAWLLISLFGMIKHFKQKNNSLTAKTEI